MHLASFGICLKFGFQDAEHFLDGLHLKVGALGHLFRRMRQHVLGRVATHADQSVDDPLVDFIGELLQVDVFLSAVGLAVDNFRLLVCR